jgi:hypothetical protein
LRPITEVCISEIENESVPPDHITNTGCKLWLDKSCTRWVDVERERTGASSDLFKSLVVWFCKEPDGRITRLISSKRGIEHESQSLEQICCHITAMAINETFPG